MSPGLAIAFLLAGAVLALAAVLPGKSTRLGTAPRVLAGFFGAALIAWSLVSTHQRVNLLVQPPVERAAPVPVANEVAQAARRVLAMCVIPSAPPSDPDGARATREEMKAGKQAIVDYNDAVLKYQGCLENASNTLKARYANDPIAPDLSPIEAVRIEFHNAALDQLTARAERFNQQLRIFKARASR